MNKPPQVQRENGDFVLRTSARIDRPRDEVFEFFSDARNLERITPNSLRFKVLTPGTIEMKKGALINYKLRIRHIPIRWTTEITAWDPPYTFEDKQLKGPYRKWVHQHIFTDDGQSTVMEDIVRYRVLGGRLINWLLVERDVRNIFSFRSTVLAEYFPPQANQ